MMKILGQPASSMHLWAIALLSCLAVLSSYELRIFPAALVVAVVSAALIDMAVGTFHLKHKLRVPYSGIITGLIIGSVAPINVNIVVIIIAVAIAILSKFFVKYRHMTIFNPASLGLVVALALFGAGDEWWAAGTFSVAGIALSLTPLLIIAAYEAHRLTASVSFVIASFALSVIAMGIGMLTPGSALTLLLGLNYYFAFVMLAEPKTSPHGIYPQVAYGAGIALLYAVLALSRAHYAALIALLIGNLAYLAYRIYRTRQGGVSVTPQKAVSLEVRLSP